MTPSPGDILITMRTCGDLRRGDVVTVSGTCADGEYLYLDGYERQAFRSDAFMVAVRRPWHAWADPEWTSKAREAAARFVREGLVPTIRSDPGSAYLDKPRTLSCGHTMTLRASACPTCLVEIRTALREIRSSTSDSDGLRAIARAALAEKETSR